VTQWELLEWVQEQVGRVAFMLVRESSIRVVMVFKGSEVFESGKQVCKMEGIFY
jgi:hypothetical protein